MRYDIYVQTYGKVMSGMAADNPTHALCQWQDMFGAEESGRPQWRGAALVTPDGCVIYAKSRRA